MVTRQQAVLNGTFSLKELASGNYFVRIQTNGTVITKKLVKQ